MDERRLKEKCAMAAVGPKCVHAQVCVCVATAAFSCDPFAAGDKYKHLYIYTHVCMRVCVCTVI